jgi:crossover junction endodeoxyribonuclease RuvC
MGEAYYYLKELILGLDPGSRHTGYGVIAVDGDRVEHVAHGVIDLKATWSMPERLRVLFTELQLLFGRHAIRAAAIEKIFFGKNADSAFKLGHARGVCLLAAAQFGVEIEEYAARYVKKCVTGSGAADKEHVQRIVFSQLRIQPKDLAFDASDALSLAITHARMRGINSRLQKMLQGADAQ